MVENFDLEDFNMIDISAKKVLVALSECDRGECKPTKLLQFNIWSE